MQCKVVGSLVVYEAEFLDVDLSSIDPHFPYQTEEVQRDHIIIRFTGLPTKNNGREGNQSDFGFREACQDEGVSGSRCKRIY